MKKTLLIISIIGIIIMLCGCSDEGQPDSYGHENVESEKFIMIEVSGFSENEVIDLIQTKYDEGYIYVDTISIDVTAYGRSNTMILFEKTLNN